ncbi:hypothetical protein Fmac_023680 [Flemingia macrophylla]|uniref:BZIP domain-containing protein n=1 Tax=Flemingia macrophylla TaxID=520843 RepID=A0ABD1LM76_9FABA
MAGSESLFDSSFGNSFDIADSFDDLLKFDFESFDFNIFDSPPQPQPPPPRPAATVAVDSMPLLEQSDVGINSGLGPVGPTTGLDRGKAVVTADDVVGIGNGGEGNNAALRRRNNYPVGVSPTTSFKGGSISLMRRAMSPEQLAELARVDPKRVKRILANRQSAAKSKERKTRYMLELQNKVQLLKAEVNEKVTNIARYKLETAEAVARVKELTIKRDAMLQELQIRNAMSEAVEEDVWRLRKENDHLDVILSARSFTELISSQLPPQQQFHYPPIQKFRYPPIQQFHHPPNQQNLNPDQQVQIPMPILNPFPPSSQGSSGHYDPNSSDFNPRN